MKNVIKNTKKGILMAIMMTALLSFANEKASFTSIKNDAGRTTVTFVDAKAGNLLSIKDGNGNVLYKESIQKTGVYTKGFDLTSLPDGEYLFELDKEVEISTMPFTVKASEVSFKKELEKTLFKPVTRVKGNLVYITRLTLNKAPMDVEVYSESNGSYELIHSETFKDTENIERMYRLSGLNKVDYKIVFKTEGRVFTETIKG
ncbi:hypothetical protein [Tamlana crocina]|uniref:Por secretion system C-terminal sorting domain-containing protein n=1 Tax=Tamlana crocina TaxID=393006 RepID=A0ABX1D6X3_9FLAO|nr:hypothetical protein [Tamlana crocina]NJX14123.1 hypothetical protein [Tamlana crocina]